ncbi:PP2C family protein-serine/threonine phosphatase [Streptomyces montanisoli]|uniref:Serine/threonine-protein phosphatase n=1 Tax=Streptomyces montanisoli TaxID=2798581 RepID=A0A940M9P2_9ACTN|nr:PP2C family protein-serine/threonine phosphatase [Streptomyces montanisoli]MBP0456928.1 serine/threonine-protein phosphatase [Streptomyces montanisoli]
MSAPVWRPNRTWVPWAVIVVAVVIDLVTPTAVSSAALLIAAPVAAAPLLGPVGIVLVGAVSMAVHAWLARVDHTFGWQHGVANQLCLLAVTVLSVWLNHSLRLQHGKADRAWRAAALAQRAVLPAPPEELGALRIAAHYVPADREALIGGDLYVVQDTPFGVRVMIGDVRGKGLGAVAAVSMDIGAFRFAADLARTLPELVDAMEQALRREGARRQGLDQTEGFTTAVIAELSADLRRVSIMNHGHPAPLLHCPDGRATALEPSREAPPLGLTTLGRWHAPVDTFDLPPGATLVFLTDGLTEARDPAGVFYDPLARLSHLMRHLPHAPGEPPTPAVLLDALIHDVSRHSGGRAHDDQALLALRCPGP